MNEKIIQNFILALSCSLKMNKFLFNIFSHFNVWDNKALFFSLHMQTKFI